MGNEVSRPAAGLTPRAGPGTPRSESLRGLPPNVPPSPAARRAKSFTQASPQTEAQSPKAGGSQSHMDRTIQRMDRTIRKRVRGGITYNMKVLIRGAKGTGKTSLFQRLKGEPIPTTHNSTPQLQSATINWQFRTNSEESVKCEVWDVVDRGFDPSQENGNGPHEDGHEANPFQADAVKTGLAASTSSAMAAATAAAAAVASAGNMSGTHMVATVDASTIDVYHESHGVIFLLDVTKWDTLEYVKQELANVPVHIPTLVLGNFRDCGNQRKIFKEDIHELLYGNPDRSHRQQAPRRPHELLYFECSLLNCYGLKALHQYFGIPFLQLKLSTLRQQMRIVEGEFAHVKHDLQAKISEQRYTDYMEHIKSTGSDIRTGRRRLSSSQQHGPVDSAESIDVAPEPTSSEAQEDHEPRLAKRSDSTTSNGSDVVVSESKHPVVAVEDSKAKEDSKTKEEDVQSRVEAEQQDLEDLPERSASMITQTAAPLKMIHIEQQGSVAELDHEHLNSAVSAPAKASPKSVKTKKPSSHTNGVNGGTSNSSPKKVSIDDPMDLLDFKVPKSHNSDLDNFYSDDDSDANDDQDEVVVSRVAGGGIGHKQLFLDSDSSDSEQEIKPRRAIKPTKEARQRSPPRRAIASSAGKTEMPKSDTSSPSSPAPRDESPSRSNDTSVSSSRTPPGDVVVVKSSSPASTPAAPAPPTTPHGSPRAKSENNSPRNPRVFAAASSLQSTRVQSPPVLDTEKETPVLSLPVPDTNVDKPAPPATETELVIESTETKSADENAIPQPEEEKADSHSSPRGTISPRRREKTFEKPTSPKSSDDVGIDAVKEVKIEEPIALHISGDASSDLSQDLKIESSKNGEDEYIVANHNDLDDFFSDEDDASEKPLEKPISSADVSVGFAEEIIELSPTHVDHVDVPDVPELSAEERTELDLDRESPAQVNHVDGVQEDMVDTFVAEAGASADETDAVQSSVDPQSSEQRTTAFKYAAPISPPKATARPELIMSDDDDEPGDLVEAYISQQPAVSAQPTSKRPEMIMSDEDSEQDTKPAAPALFAPKSVSRRIDVLMSDDDDDLNVSNGNELGPAHAAALSSFATSAPMARPSVMLSATLPSPSLKPLVMPPRSNDLDSFFNSDESDAEEQASVSRPGPPVPPAAEVGRSAFNRQRVLVASDDDDEENEETEDRFASYNAKNSRKSKASRKQRREEFRQTMVAATDDRSLNLDESPPVLSEGALTNADVLAAIRKAQEEALRMLGTPADSEPAAASSERRKSKKHSSSSSSVTTEEGRKHKRKSSKRSSSSRSKKRDEVLESE